MECTVHDYEFNKVQIFDRKIVGYVSLCAREINFDAIVYFIGHITVTINNISDF